MSDTIVSVAHFDWRDVITATVDTPAEVIEALDNYFKYFAAPTSGDGSGFMTANPCLKCGTGLCGMLGGFTWGIQHGEGFCGKCRWPGRGMHYIKDKSGEDLMSIRNMVLQYHPDFVGKKRKTTTI